MPGTLILHDRRLQGRIPRSTGAVVREITEAHPLAAIMERVGQVAVENGNVLDNLVIACHGYERIEESDTLGTSQEAGGGGLQFGRTGIHNYNVNLFRALRLNNGTPMVSNIIIYACATADQHPDSRGGRHDGILLCREMAAYSGAAVYASDATQVYHFPRVSGGSSSVMGDISFGEWEGTIYRFDPNGGYSVVRDTLPELHILH